MQIRNMKNIVLNLLPIGLMRLYQRMRKEECIFFYGDYKTWDEAERYTKENKEGYDKPEILDTVINSFNLVREGKACYEQDGVPRYEESPSFEILTSLFYASNGKKTSVLDFGGGLGSKYYRNRKWLGDAFDWNVVEQKHYVDWGRENISDIKFYYSIEECRAEKPIDFVLFSGVLQYLPDGIEQLKKCMEMGIEWICIDATPLYHKDRYMIQHVPKRIYEAEYPVHLINHDSLLDIFKNYSYSIVFKWEKEGVPIYEKGFINLNFRGYLLRKQDLV